MTRQTPSQTVSFSDSQRAARYRQSVANGSIQLEHIEHDSLAAVWLKRAHFSGFSLSVLITSRAAVSSALPGDAGGHVKDILVRFNENRKFLNRLVTTHLTPYSAGPL